MRKDIKSLLLMGAMLPALGWAQAVPVQPEKWANADNEPLPVHPVPHPRQLLWQETEFYAFFHYGMNTYTNKEWGYGNEDPSLFAPTAVPNPEQWLTACKEAGMRGGIAVVKHHDGFCLWPTKTTKHNVSSSSNANAQKTNIPETFAAAAKKLGMKYGFYVSPWDRNSGLYGTDRYVKEVFLEQCNELAKYGTDQFEMWFDGANGGDGYYGGKNTTISVDADVYYDTPNLRDAVHKICPNCVMWGVGGEARWIGNEAGWAGETNWCTENREHPSYGSFTNGSEDGWFWLPGESDAKATNRGWFWHDGESPLSAERLFQMYLETVGRNANLILNLPPDQRGLLPDATVSSLKGMGNLIRTRLNPEKDFAKTATITVSETRTAGTHRNYEAANLTDGDKDTYWATNDATTSATIMLSWPEAQKVHYVELMEYIKKGQRVRDFKIETSENGNDGWTERGGNIQTTTVGYKRILPLNGSTSNYGDGFNVKAIRITLADCKACPLISKISVY